MARTHRNKAGICPNCGTELRADDNFCPHCGQENHDLRVPFRHFAYEFFESVTHFDAKLWSTLKAIFTKPGALTKDFVEGRRARHVNPARFYFFISVIFFALLTWWLDRGIERQGEPTGQAVAILHDMLPDSAMVPLHDDSLLTAKLFLPIDSPSYEAMRARLQGNDHTLLDSLIAATQTDTLSGLRARLRDAFRSLPAKSNLDIQRYVRTGLGLFSFTSKAEEERFLRIGANMTDAQADSILLTDTKGSHSWFERRALRSIGRLQAGSIAGTQRLAHLVVKSVSVIMFLLMPFTAVLLLWIFFRKRYYWEHLIFSVHMHTTFFLFFCMLLVIALLLPVEWPRWATGLVLLVCLLYLLVALRRVYGKSWGVTLLRFALMSIPYCIAFLLLLVAGFFWGLLSM